MRRTVTPAVPPGLYRHFAAVTVVLTAALAMFADGENREAQAAQAAREPSEARAAAPTLVVAAPAAATPPPSDGWDEPDFDNSFGAPMEALSANIAPQLDHIPSPRRAPAFQASLSEEERELLLRGLREKATPSADGPNRPGAPTLR